MNRMCVNMFVCECLHGGNCECVSVSLRSVAKPCMVKVRWVQTNASQLLLSPSSSALFVPVVQVEQRAHESNFGEDAMPHQQPACVTQQALACQDGVFSHCQMPM